MVDLISRGAQGHGLVHLLLTSAADVGFAWDGDEKGWVWGMLFLGYGVVLLDRKTVLFFSRVCFLCSAEVCK